MRLLFRSIILFALLLLMIPVQANLNGIPQFASTGGYRVNVTADDYDGTCDSHCTLREAIVAANSDTGLNPIVYIPNGTYILSRAGAGEDAALTGDLDITRSINIIGAGRDTTIIDANGIDRAFDIHGDLIGAAGSSNSALYPPADVFMSGFTVRNGAANSASGGGMRFSSSGSDAPYVVLIDITIRDSTAMDGGGLAVANMHTHGYRWNLLDNTASNRGGGLFLSQADAVGNMGYLQALLVNSNHADNGGGIYIEGADDNDFTWFEASSIINNSADNGGGIALAGGSHAIYRSTISGNTVTSVGGGIFLGSNVTAHLGNVTITNNSADSDEDGVGIGGGIGAAGASMILTQNAVIWWGNFNAGVCDDCMTDDPRLLPLADNGGFTPTHALAASSPLIGSIANENCENKPDQRGVIAAAYGINCEPGAFAYLDGIAYSDIPPVPFVLFDDTSIVQEPIYFLPGSEVGMWSYRVFPIHFREPMFDIPNSTSHPAEYDNPANYRVVRPGADNVFQTTSCASVAGDDTSVPFIVQAQRMPFVQHGSPFANVDYTDEDSVVYISDVTGDQLRGYLYRVFVCDEITDRDGNALDGNLDKLAGGDAYFDSSGGEDLSWQLYVTKTEDTYDGVCDTDCSIRDAIHHATTSDSFVATIHLPAGTFVLTPTGTGDNELLTGDIDLPGGQNLTFIGAGKDDTIIDANYSDRIFHLGLSSQLTIDSMTLQHGRSGLEKGGAIYGDIHGHPVTVYRSRLIDNMGDMGGAIYSNGASISATEFIGNVASGSDGGAIYTGNWSIEVEGSTFAENSAVGKGSAIYAAAVDSHNSTFSGNIGTGGVIFYLYLFDMQQSTVANNESGILYDGEAVTHIDSSLFSGNTGGSCGIHPGYTQLPSNTLSGNFNMMDDAGCGIIGRNQYNMVLPLFALGDYGGEILTHALPENSPARNILMLNYCRTPHDQRGVYRQDDGLCDVGAFEGFVSSPNAPANLRFTGEIISNNLPTQYLLWDDTNNDETNYLVERAAFGSTTWEVIGTTQANVVTFADEWVGCEIYSYRVRAYREADSTYSVYSNVITADANICDAIPVTVVEDVSDGLCSVDGDCSLREAVALANSMSGNIVIQIPAGTYPLTSPITVNDSMTILGAGAGQTIIDLGNLTHFSNVDFPPAGLITYEFVVQGITFQNGNTTPFSGRGVIFSQAISTEYGTLWLRHSEVLNSTGRTIVMEAHEYGRFYIEHSRISGNTSNRGVIYISRTGFDGPNENSWVSIADSVFTENINVQTGGSVVTVGAHRAGLSIERSAFVNNGLGDTASPVIEWNGSENLFFDISNSTFSGNGGNAFTPSILELSGADLIININHVTMLNDNPNASTAWEFSIPFTGGMFITINNSILWSRDGTDFSDCNNFDAAGFGTNNILTNFGSCQGILPVGGQFDVGSGVLDVADNGGNTLTHAVYNGSPAQDAIPAEDCFGVDQRRYPRPHGAGCDIGAYEGVVYLLNPPTNLQITEAVDWNTVLSWTDTNDDENRYLVERLDDGGTNWVEIGFANANATGFSDSGLACSTTYHYRVRATDEFSYSLYSDSISITLSPCLPAPLLAPSNLNATAVSDAAVSLSWVDNATDETNYRVERSLNGSDWTEIATPTTATYLDTGLTCDTTYWYQVRAYRAADTLYSAYSNIVSATTAPCKPTLSLGTVSATSIQLSWTDVLTETEYRLERSSDGTNWSEIAQPAQNAISYPDTNVVCEGHYVYRVRAYRISDGLYSQPSNTVMVDMPLCALTAPVNFSATAITDTAITLQWSESNNSDTAHFLERRDDGVNWIQIPIEGLDPTSTGYSDTTLTCETTYEYRVRVYRLTDNAYSEFSNTISPTTALCPVPKAPTGLQTIVINPRSVDLLWTDSNLGVMRYTVERSVDDGSSWQSYPTLANDVTTFSAYSLTCLQDYRFRVRGVRIADNMLTDDSNTIIVTTTACPALATPNAPLVMNVDRTSVSLTFTPDSSGEVTNWQLERFTAGNWQPLVTLPAVTTQYIDNNLTCDTTYTYRLRSFRAEDNAYSVPSPETLITTASCPAVFQSTVGLYKNGVWQFRNLNSGLPDITFQFGPSEAGWSPLVGDWNGDGVDGIGVYRNGLFILRNTSNAGVSDTSFYFGAREAGWQPIVGDWNGDGVDTVGLYKDGLVMLTNNHTTLAVDYRFRLGDGTLGWLILAGDWDNSGADSVGLYRGGYFYLTNNLDGSGLRRPFLFGPAQSGWLPLTGDWDAQNGDSIGVYSQSIWRLRNSNSMGGADVGFNFGARESGWIPLASYRGGVAPLMVLASAVNVDVEVVNEATAIPPVTVITPEVNVESTISPATLEPTAEPSPQLPVEATPIIEPTTIPTEETLPIVEPTVVPVPVEATPEVTEAISEP